MPNIRKAEFEESGHRYRERGIVVPSVTQVLAAAGLVDYSKVPQAALDWKAGVGTEVHHLTALVDRGENLADYEYDARLQPWLDSYLAFKAAVGWSPSLVEHGPLIGEVNGMPIGFTLDRVGGYGGMEAVAEVKCTAQDHPAHGVQLAGYDLALGEVKRKRIVIRCQADGRMAKVQTYDDQSEYGVFVWSLGIVTWKLNKKLLKVEDL